MTPVRNGPTLLFIGRDPDYRQAWQQVRDLWQPGRALRAPGPYRGMTILAGQPAVYLAVVAVDNLSPDEMSFFTAARRCRPDLQILALGTGDHITNPRLSQACANGAREAVNLQDLPEKLNRLRTSQLPPAHSSSLAPQSSDLALLPAETPNFADRRTVAEARRKAPAPTPPKRSTPTTSADVVTADELRVLLGQDTPEPAKSKEPQK